MKTFKKMSEVVLFFLVIFAFNLYSQGNTFIVISVKGNVEYQKAGTNKWQPVKVNQKLSITDKIKINEGGYINLAHSSGKPIQLSEAKEYSLTQVESDLLSKKSNLTSRLAKSVIEELNKSESMLANNQYKAKSTITGATYRGLGENSIIPFIPKKIHFINNQIQFSWFPYNNIRNYKIYITDINDQVIHSANVNDTTIVLDASKINLKTDTYYLFYVTLVDNDKVKSPSISFKIFPEKKVKQINDNIAEIINDLGIENTPFQHIVVAKYFAQNLLFFNALQSYQNAIKLAPDKKEYQIMYENYIEMSLLK